MFGDVIRAGVRLFRIFNPVEIWKKHHNNFHAFSFCSEDA